MKANNAKFFWSWEPDFLDKINLSFVLSNIFSFNTQQVTSAKKHLLEKLF